MFEGKEIIQPEDLMEVDTRSAKKTRDILKLWKTKEKSMYLGIENQLNVHLYMPYRCLDYDCKLVGNQIDQLKKKHKEKKDLKPREYLSKISMEDRLISCKTYTIYYGEEDWYGPKELSELFEEEVDISYPMNLVSIKETKKGMYSNEDLDTLFHICSLFYTNQRERIYAEYNHKISKDVATTIFSVLENKELVEMISKEEKGVINMCEAMKRYEQEMRNEGKLEGKLEAILMIIKDLVSKGLSDEFILSVPGVTKEILKQAKQSL